METNNIISKDLFEYFEELPSEVQRIIEKYNERLDNCINYTEIDKMINELNKHGYTCNYSLDGVPYDLKEINK